MIQAGDSIGPYTLVRTLGRGGYGEVWLAERRSSLLTIQVALKLPFVAENEVETVRQEAALWLRASGHPNIVPVLDAEVYDGQVVIGSEFIAGGSLHDYMLAQQGQAPSLEEAIALGNGILAGLDYLHRSGLSHRDLKPENVLLQDGIPRLTDFGLARVLKTVAQTGTISGTPRYMAPETFSGAYSAASDLWSVGIMLHELLAGGYPAGHPFPTGDLMALISAIQGGEPERLPDAVPDRLRAIVSRLLTKGPGARYATASAVREALRTSHLPVHAVDAERVALTPNNLPVQPTSFIGREHEIAELKRLLEHTHLLTLTGSGGCGKTRLSLKVAADVMDQYPDGIWLVELASLADPRLAPQTVAAVLGIKEEPSKTILQTLTEYLEGKTALLLLDNCEHLLTACAQLADGLLRSCRNVKILASSRESLGISGEQAYRVPSLTLPDPKWTLTPELVGTYEAVRLFMERARNSKADFTITSQNASGLVSICHRLDGIPLAIELAAARVRSLSVDELGRRLDDRFRILTGGSRTALPRQQTLRALIDWSYDLLDEKQKALLARLSVFVGGWTLDAAENICAGMGLEDWEVLDMLTALVDKSLVVYEEIDQLARYGLNETVRQYASDRLVETNLVEIFARRHREWYLALAESASKQMSGSEQKAGLLRFEMEHDNLRRVLDSRYSDSEAAEERLRLTFALHRFWFIRSHCSEGRKWLEDALSHRDGVSTSVVANALNAAGVLAYSQGDYSAAQEFFEECRTLWHELNNTLSGTDALNNLGMVAHAQKDYPTAYSYYSESVAIYRELGDLLRTGMALGNLATVATTQNDFDAAHVLIEESLSLFRRLEDRWCILTSLSNLGELACRQANYPAARQYYSDSLELAWELRDQNSVALQLNFLGVVACQQNDRHRAILLLSASKRAREEIGAPLMPQLFEDYEANVAALRSGMSREAFEAGQAKGAAMSLEQAVECALRNVIEN